MSQGLIYFISVTVAVVAAVLLYVLVFTKKQPGSKGLKSLQDFFGVKYYLIEYAMRCLYVVGTVYAIVFGILVMFVSGSTNINSTNFIVTDLLFLIVNVIVVRVIYELVMLFVRMAKNTIEINAKIEGDATDATADFNVTLDKVGIDPNAFKAPQPGYGYPPQPGYPPQAPGYPQQPGYPPQAPGYPPQAPAAPQAPAPEAAAAPAARFCANCGTKLDDGSVFCANCGTKYE